MISFAVLQRINAATEKLCINTDAGKIFILKINNRALIMHLSALVQQNAIQICFRSLYKYNIHRNKGKSC